MTSMSRARVARRIAAGAAYGGGGIGLVGAAAVGLLLAEVQLAKRQVGNGDVTARPARRGPVRQLVRRCPANRPCGW